MSDFRTRKAARIAAQSAGVKYKFQVVAQYDGKCVGTFSSRREAERFANEQIGPVAGNTAAFKAWCVMRPRNEPTPWTHFHVVRAEA